MYPEELLHPSGAAQSAVNPFPLLRELAEETATGVLVLDPAGKVRFANPAETLRSASAAEPIEGRDFFRELFPALEREGIGAEYRARAPEGKVQLEADAFLSGEAGRRWMRVILRSAEWEGAHWGIALVEDRTELVEERERRKNAERFAAIGEMAAGLAHEVNNPLASIRSFAQLLARDAQSELQRDALRLIVADCDRISASMGKLLSLIRDRGADERAPVDLNAAVRQVLGIQRYALDTGGIEVRLDLQEPLSQVTGEPGALQQLVLDLLLCAERSLSQSAGARLLIIRTRESSAGVTLVVHDNGPGIPRDRLARIFSPQTDEAGRRGGLGLAVAAGIVRDHGGEIRAESDEGRGTSIVAIFPRVGELTVERPAAPGAPVLPPPETHRSLRILLADDEPTLRMALRRFLERRGHSVTEAADAHQAWRTANEQEFDVALVDARMPGDGLVLLERLEELPSLAGRTALMTGDLGRVRTTQGITTGRPCLAKPFDMHEMVRLLEALGAQAR